jgi:hypothetical protein
LFDDDDPRAAQSRFVGDPQGNICDVEIFEGSTSPLKQLRDKALAIEKRKPRRSAAPVNPPLVIPADGVNEHYGLVYTVNDPKLFQLFTYRKSDGETAKVFESPYDGSISSRDVQTGATVLFLADSGDMLVEITAPNLKGATKLIAGPTKTFLYRREANELIDFNPLLPAGEQFVVAWGMNHRGDVLFSSTKSYYFLPANSTKPSVVRTLSGLKFPVHGERLGEDRKIYFWAQLDNGEWVLCQIPAMATLVTPVTIGLGAAALAAAGAVFWIVRKRRLANGAASLQHPSDPAEVPIHLHR